MTEEKKVKRNFFQKIIFNGLPENSDLTTKAKSAVLNSISWISIIIMLLVIFLDAIYNSVNVTITLSVGIVLVSLSLIAVGLTKKSVFGRVSITYIAFFLFLYLAYTTGEGRSAYYWIYMFPLISIFFLGIVHGGILTFIFCCLIGLILFKYTGTNNLPVDIPMGFRVVSSYLAVSGFTVAFEIVRLKTFNSLQETSSDLLARRKQTQMIMDNVKQGIFLLDKNLNLEDERSDYFDKIFKGVKDNHSFLELISNKLPERDFVATKDYLELFFNKTVNPTLLSSINPVDKVLMNFTDDTGQITHTWLEFDFERILLKSGQVQILGLFRDVTDRVLLEEQLEREETESSKNMENLFQIIHVNPELMDEFIKDSEDEIGKINELLRVESEDTLPIINYIFSSIHSVKGNALLLGLSSMAKKLHDFEEYIKELKITSPSWRELLQLTVNLAELKHDISGIKELISKIISFQSSVGSAAGQNRKYIIEQTIKKSIDKLTKGTGKEVSLNVDKYDADSVPEKYRRLFKDSITQLIRNSIAHGIEDSSERLKKNKTPNGNISIMLDAHKDKIEFTYRDDGNGLSIEKIKKAAVEKKGFSIEQVEKLTSSDAVKLIFHPGFSTASEVDTVAGQGVGMNVVKNHVDSAGGKLNIKSSVGNFCEFKILLPV